MKFDDYSKLVVVFELIVAIVETLVFVFQFHIFNADYIIKYGNIFFNSNECYLYFKH